MKLSAVLLPTKCLLFLLFLSHAQTSSSSSSSSSFPIQQQEQRQQQEQPPTRLIAWQDAYETPSFASAVQMDEIHKTLLIVGSTYEENGVQQTGSFACFFKVFSLLQHIWLEEHLVGHTGEIMVSDNDNDDDTTSNSPTVSSQTCVDVTTIQTTTSSDHQQQQQHAILVGHSGIGPGGVLDDLYNRLESEITNRYGTIMDWSNDNNDNDANNNNDNDNNNHRYTLIGGAVTQGFSAVYPITVTSSIADEGDHVFVASLFTDQTTLTDTFIQTNQDPNTAYPIGHVFGMMIEGYRHITPTNNNNNNRIMPRTALRTFRTVYMPSSGTDSVSVAGLVQMTQDMLVVAGHTTGQGKAFGVSVYQDNVMLDAASMDGFVTKLRADNGHLWTTTTTTATNNQYDDAYKSTFRVQSLNQGDDYVYGICEHAYGSTRDPDSVYIVGSTTGDLERNVVATTPVSNVRSAYIMKLDLVSMLPIWTRQLGDSKLYASTDGMACAVTRDGQEVWLAGHVEAGGRIQYTTDEFGGDTDVFVAKLSAENGQVIFVRQFGSSQADVLASHGGLVTDLDGNAIVVGNTQGSLFSDVKGRTAANVFLASISRTDGTMAGTIENPNGGAGVVPVADPPQPTPTTGAGAGAVATNTPPAVPQFDTPLTFPPVHPSENLENNPNANDESSGGKWVGLLIVLLALVVLVVSGAAFVNKALNKDHLHTDRGKVLEYLGSFDVEDVDLKHSATGGWHCSYTNDLAEGKVRKSTSNHSNLLLEGSPRKSTTRSGMDPLMTESLTNSAIVKDSLFMIDDDDNDDNDPLKTGAESAFLHHRHPNSNSNSSNLVDIADSSGYDGLVDAYNNNNNNSWDDRNQQLLPDSSNGSSNGSSSRGRGSKKGRRKTQGSSSSNNGKRRSSDGDEFWGRPIV